MAKKISHAPIVLSACETLLQMANGPLHYKTITQLIVDSGMVEAYGKEGKFDQIVYSAMHNEVKRKHNDASIIFMGAGIFCHRTIPGAVNIDRPVPSNNSHHERKKAERASIAAETQAETEARLKAAGTRCGTCRSMIFKGVGEATLKSGECKCKSSGRISVKSSDHACHRYTERSEAAQSSLLKRQHKMKLKLMEFNAETTNFRGRNRSS